MEDSNTHLVFVLYSRNGIFNQICSFQQMMGWIENYPQYKKSIVYDKSYPPIQDPQQQLFSGIHNIKNIPLKNNEDPIINFLDLNLLDLDDIEFYTNNHFIKDRINVNLIDSSQSFIVCSPDTEENKGFFGGQRKEVIIKENQVNYFDSNLTWYSYYFMNRTKNIDSSISKIKFKKEYVDLANKISSDLGRFNGSHMRLMKDHTRVYEITREKIDNAFKKYSDQALPIVVATDSYKHKYLDNLDITYIDELILDEYKDDFYKLSNTSPISVAIVSALVMCNSEDFIGTPRSTYTAYINQQRAIKGTESWKFFSEHAYDNYNPEMKFSWRSMNYPQNWEREYSECVLNIGD